jgi:type II secretory pathway pseudopilin PulG
MIVIAIIGLLASTARSAFLGQTTKYRLNGATRQVGWDLMAARMQAIREKHNVRVTFVNDHAYTILNDKDNDGAVDGGEETTKDIQSNYAGVSFTSTNNPTFRSTGSVTNSPTITLTNSSGTKNITISAAGMVTLN